MLDVLDAKIQNYQSRRRRMPSDKMKIDTAALYFLEFLMPRFKQEHPYMVNAWVPKDAERLANFKRDFGLYRDSYDRIHPSDSRVLSGGKSLLAPEGRAME